MGNKVWKYLVIMIGVFMLNGCSTGEEVLDKKDQIITDIPSDDRLAQPSSGAENDRIDKAKDSDLSTVIKETEESIYSEIPEIKGYIQDAINNANLIADNSFFQNENGEIFCRKYNVNYAYSYNGKDVKQIRNSASYDCVAVLKDGSVYNGTTLVTDEYEVNDILWKTNNINIDAYFITKDGQVLYYSPSSGTLWLVEGIENVVAGCCYRDRTIFIDKEGNTYPETLSNWSKCKIDGWKNIVVMSCAKNKEEGTESIAGISADGTVYATGDYAEEILSWGELSYISMNEELIVGLKKDGTLSFAGSKADKFNKVGFSGVRAVRVWSGEFIAMTEEGFITANIIDFDGLDDSLTVLIGPKTSRFSYLMIDRVGNVYEAENHTWEKSTYYYPPALKNKPEISIYMAQLSQSTTRWEKDERRNEDVEFQLMDVNNDGQLEIILKDYSLALGWLYNGKIQITTFSSSIDGYYPSSGVIRSTEWGSIDIIRYWIFENGIQCICGYYYDDDSYEQKSFVMKDFKPDNIEIVNSDLEEITLETDEFEIFLKGYIGEENLEKIDFRDFIENTYWNREDIVETYQDINQ